MAHPGAVDDGSDDLVFQEQRVFAVRFALKTRFLLHRVLVSITRRTRVLQLLDVWHEYKRLKNRPANQTQTLQR